jgi:hypothetical protein
MTSRMRRIFLCVLRTWLVLHVAYSNSRFMRAYNDNGGNLDGPDDTLLS